MKFLAGKKTYLVAAGGVLSALGGVLTGSMTPDAALQLAVNSILAATIRHGIDGVAK